MLRGGIKIDKIICIKFMIYFLKFISLVKVGLI